MRIELEFETRCGGSTIDGEFAYCYDGRVVSSWIPPYTYMTCPACGGRGYIPTEIGQQILDFLEHQGFTSTAPEGAGEE